MTTTPHPTISADAYFFDIDGTLLVTRDLVHWNGLHRAMLEVYGVDTNIEGISYHGKTDVAILRAALTRCGVSAEAFNAGLERARAAVCREVSAQAHAIVADVCPAIPEVLAHVRTQQKLLGVASGNLEIVGWHKVTAAGLRDFFTVGCFGDRCELRAAIFSNAVALAKQELGNRCSVCFIGDTPDDILAARYVDAQIISVCTGTFGFDELCRLGPDLCCQSCTDLLGRLD